MNQVMPQSWNIMIYSKAFAWQTVSKIRTFHPKNMRLIEEHMSQESNDDEDSESDGLMDDDDLEIEDSMDQDDEESEEKSIEDLQINHLSLETKENMALLDEGLRNDVASKTLSDGYTEELKNDDRVQLSVHSEIKDFVAKELMRISRRDDVKAEEEGKDDFLNFL